MELGSADCGQTVLLVDFDLGETGHRGQYGRMLDRLFVIRRGGFGEALVSRHPVLVPQIEQAFIQVMLLAMFRGLLGRRTVGLLFRPLPALAAGTLRHGFKHLGLRLLRYWPGAHMLTIMPFAVEPRLDRLASSWIYDLQNWDFQLDPPCEPAEGTALVSAIRRQAAGRTVCCAVGEQSEAKGFDRFAQSYLDQSGLRDRVLFAFGGTVSPDLGPAAEALSQAGAFCCNRYITDRELLDFYAAADVIWACYDPAYDQASGVLGRAMQLGVPAIVRPGSVAERLCRLTDHPHLAWDGTSPLADQLVHLVPLSASLARARARAHGQESLERLTSLLKVKLRYDPFAD